MEEMGCFWEKQTNISEKTGHGDLSEFFAQNEKELSAIVLEEAAISFFMQPRAGKLNLLFKRRSWEKARKIFKQCSGLLHREPKLFSRLDDNTIAHQINVMSLMVGVGLKKNLGLEKLFECGVVGLIHDTGKAYFMEVVSKPDVLTNEEAYWISKHPCQSCLFAKELKFSGVLAIMQHHEKPNGKGYPFRLKGKNITSMGKMLQVCDVYEALTNESRPYRAKRRVLSSGEAFKKMGMMAQAGDIDRSCYKEFKAALVLG